MTHFWFIKGDFLKERSRRIGASEIAACIPNPEKPNESLAGYGQTAITVWQEKTGRKTRDEAGIPAEMGHWLEPKAIELFMRPIFGDEVAERWLMERMRYEILKLSNNDLDARDFQAGTILHSVQWYNDKFIVHPDGVYQPITDEKTIVPAHGYKIDLSKPFLVEGKSARYFSARRPEGSLVKGYDTDLKTWQGIPLKNYFQIQYQLAFMEVDVCYLPLIYDTSSFHVWEIRANKEHQGKLIDIAGKLAWYIEHDIEPKELAISLDDVKYLYPEIKEDFAYLLPEEKEKAIEYAKTAIKAKEQKSIWEDKEKEAKDSMAAILKDRKEIRDEFGSVARWTEKKGSEDITALSEIKKADQNAYKYLKRKGLIKQKDGSKYVTVTYKEDERC